MVYILPGQNPEPSWHFSTSISIVQKSDGFWLTQLLFYKIKYIPTHEFSKLLPILKKTVAIKWLKQTTEAVGNFNHHHGEQINFTALLCLQFCSYNL